jgi:hypothetical protein
VGEEHLCDGIVTALGRVVKRSMPGYVSRVHVGPGPDEKLGHICTAPDTVKWGFADVVALVDAGSVRDEHSRRVESVEMRRHMKRSFAVVRRSACVGAAIEHELHLIEMSQPHGFAKGDGRGGPGHRTGRSADSED